jgi:hypothetical protein
MRRLALVLALVAVLAAPASAGAKRLVRYDVGGGLAGRSSELVVDRDGSARQTDSFRDTTQRFTLSAKQLSRLKRDLKAARWSSLKRTYDTKYPVLDGISESATYKGKTVVVTQNAKAPKRLERVLRRLSRLLRD